ncbi:MAG: hypothetical protein ACXWW0_09840 [Bacteroidia bacterium]
MQVTHKHTFTYSKVRKNASGMQKQGKYFDGRSNKKSGLLK